MFCCFCVRESETKNLNTTVEYGLNGLKEVGATLSNVTMNPLTVKTEESSDSVLELAANNDVDGFKGFVVRNPLAIDEVGEWYGRKKTVEQRTPLMVAATYGSIDVLKLILKLSSADVNRCCGTDLTTALHCAASGGSADAVETVKLLLWAGADANLIDSHGHRPADVIVVPLKLAVVKAALEELLGSSTAVVVQKQDEAVWTCNPPLSPEEDASLTSSHMTRNFHFPPSAVLAKREYPDDASFPNVKNRIYSTDEFRMFSFKVRSCPRAYPHDWTECPFVHPGENARRRDPRRYHYSCLPCPEFRKGTCRRGDLCEYAHGVFECWLHPAQYRTRLCKDGTNCSRRVCFFAHTIEELRPLYASAASSVSAPKSSSSAAIEMAAMYLRSSPPASVSALMSPFSAVSPSGNFQSSRLSSSLSPRDRLLDEYSVGNRATQQMILTSSPLHNSEQGTLLSPSLKASMISPFQLQHQQQALLFAVKTGAFPPTFTDQQPRALPSRLLASPGSSSTGRIEKQQLQSLNLLRSRDLVAGTSASMGLWGSTSGMLDWGVDGDEIGRLRRSSAFELHLRGEEPDVSWIHSLVWESQPEKPLSTTALVEPPCTSPYAGGADGLSGHIDGRDQVAALGTWLEKTQLD